MRNVCWQPTVFVRKNSRISRICWERITGHAGGTWMQSACSPRLWRSMRRRSSPDTPPSPAVNRIWRWCCRIWGSWRKPAICCARRWPPLRRRSSPDTPPSPPVNRIWRGCCRIWGSWRKPAICCARRWPPLRRRSSPDTPPSPPVNRIWRGCCRIWGSWRKPAICCARRWPPLRRARTPLHRHQSIESGGGAAGSGAVGGSPRSAAQGAGLR